MKAIRIKIDDPVSRIRRFEIVLLKDMLVHTLTYHGGDTKVAIFHVDCASRSFSLGLVCEELQYERFELAWEKFQKNEEYYFDLSDWGLIT
jgi:hypothetical protein